MKNGTKILICIGSMVLTMLILPLLIVAFAPAEAAMALCFLLFFAVFPAQTLCFGLVAGTDMRKLWWLPVVGSLGFPFLVSLAFREMIWDLFVYSGIYLSVSLLAMAVMHLGKKRK